MSEKETLADVVDDLMDQAEVMMVPDGIGGDGQRRYKNAYVVPKEIYFRLTTALNRERYSKEFAEGEAG